MYENRQEIFIVVQQFAQFGTDTKVNAELFGKYIEFTGIFKQRRTRKEKTPPKARLQYRDIKQIFFGTHEDIKQADIPEYAQKMVKRFIGNRVDTAMDRVRGASVTANPRTVHFLVLCYRGKEQVDGLIMLKTQSRTALSFVNVVRHRSKLPIPEKDLEEEMAAENAEDEVEETMDETAEEET